MIFLKFKINKKKFFSKNDNFLMIFLKFKINKKNFFKKTAIFYELKKNFFYFKINILLQLFCNF